MTRYVMPATTLLAVIALAAMAWPNGTPEPSFAERVNAACGADYRVADWTASDEWGNPAGVVFVTCESLERDKWGAPVDSFRKAVGR